MPSHYPIRDDDAAVIDDPVDHMEPAPDERGDLADALRVLCFWLYSGHDKNKNSRLLTLMLHLGLECDADSYEDVAQICDMTRSNVQLQGKQLERQFGLRYVRSRRDSTRRANARAAALKGRREGA